MWTEVGRPRVMGGGVGGVQEWRSSAPCKSGTRALLILLDTDYLKDFFPNYTKDHLYE